MKKKNPLILLAIETSCDETAAAVLKVALKKARPVFHTLSSVTKSQIQLHSKMGGVVPEAAARAHIKNILPVVKKAAADAGITLAEIDCLAVTVGPGLMPSLLVGVEFTKGLSLALKRPVVPVNHLLGHLYSPFWHQVPKSIFPMVSLIVSGGHTILALMKNEKSYRVLGETLDDAAGEAFDKIAKLLGLPYPGGPQVSKLANKGHKDAIAFPRPMLKSADYNFSFSGLKTAVRYFIEKRTKISPADVCASFQQAVVDVLVSKTLRAAKVFKAKSLSLSGGVSANLSLRNALQKESKKNHLQFFLPPFQLCTDNAEMIGIAAAFLLNNGQKPVSYKKIQANSGLQL